MIKVHGFKMMIFLHGFDLKVKIFIVPLSEFEGSFDGLDLVVEFVRINSVWRRTKILEEIVLRTDSLHYNSL